MVGTVTSNEEGQLLQTIEMFEVITQSQSQDYQSLEILKEAYAKLGREPDVIRTAKRIAQAYVGLGQFSSAILEYESILQRYPDDAEVLAALGEIESKAGSLGTGPALSEGHEGPKAKAQPAKPKAAVAGARAPTCEVDDGRAEMQKLFVESKIITSAQFDECWVKPDKSATLTKPVEPFIHVLSEKGYVPWEKSLRLISDKSRTGFLLLDKYDLDVELARSFPAEKCLRWCVFPFDRMSKSVLIATCNPFNRLAGLEIQEILKQRVLWYLAPSQDIMKAVRKIYR